MALLFLGLALGFGLLAVYPYLIYPVLLRLLPLRAIQPRVGPPVSATLVFCAYNEERSLPAKIENLRAIRANAPDIKFMAYVDRSTDRTLQLLRDESDLLTVIAAPERTGKAVGMGRMARLAETDIIIFTDANVMVEPQAVSRLQGYFSDPLVGGVCGTLVYTNADESVTASTGSTYWRLEEFIKKGESRSGSTMGADGSLFATRRAIYPEVPSHLLDDFIVSMSVVITGMRLVSAPDVIAYERSSASSGDEFRRKRRIACRAYASHRYLWPKLTKLPRGELLKYISHRVLRWYSGFNALACVLFAILFVALSAGPLIAAGLTALGGLTLLVGRLGNVPPLSHGTEVLNALFAASLGLVDAWRGRTYQTWQPAKSR